MDTPDEAQARTVAALSPVAACGALVLFAPELVALERLWALALGSGDARP